MKDNTSKTVTIEDDEKLQVYMRRSGLCTSCFEDNQLRTISPDCMPNPDYCMQCIKRTIETKISSKGHRQFQCMHPRCATIYDSSQYYVLLNKKHLSIVDKLNLNATLELMPEFIWCKNPKGCGSGQLLSDWKALRGLDCKEFDVALERNPHLKSDKLVL
eukprot:UN12452